MNKKIKVIAYIKRIQNEQIQILVFDHRDFPEAGTQVIGGTVDPGEDLVEALLREIFEESGLCFRASDIVTKLGESLYHRQDIPEINHRHYYLINTIDLADSWAHTVHSNGSDNGLVFDYFWLPLKKAKEVLTGNFGELLP